jgi:hypothetical protein
MVGEVGGGRGEDWNLGAGARGWRGRGKKEAWSKKMDLYPFI